MRAIMHWKALVKDPMSSNDGGKISSNLFSLQLQLGTLFEDAGGDAALALLDKLSEFNKSEQQVLLKVLLKALVSAREGDRPLFAQQDAERKSIEDELYRDILDAFEREAGRNLRKKLHVIEGNSSKPIDLSREREARKRSIFN